MQLGEGVDQKDQIPEDKMMEIVEDLVNMGVKAVTFSGGGEPFLYKPLLKVSKKTNRWRHPNRIFNKWL